MGPFSKALTLLMAFATAGYSEEILPKITPPQAPLQEATPVAPAPVKKSPPNIVVIMGDDVGWFNIGAYHRGIMGGKTPNLDKLAAEGMLFTDYYAEPSCTAGRANFITGQLPIRTGLTTVGQAGAKIGIPDEAPTIATALKSMATELITPQQISPVQKSLLGRVHERYVPRGEHARRWAAFPVAASDLVVVESRATPCDIEFGSECP